MIYLYFSNIILFAAVLYFVYKNFKVSKNSILKEIDNEFTILPKPKYDTIKYQEFDSDNKLLIDVLDSIKLEQWTFEVDTDRSLFSNSYTTIFKNPQNTLTVRSRIRINDVGKPSVASFSIIKNNGGGSISFNNDKTIDALILNGIWGYIVKYHQDINDNTIEKFSKLSKSIEDELVTLKRDRLLKNILK